MKFSQAKKTIDYNFLGCDNLKLININEIIIKKSRFISYFFEIDSIDEVETILNMLKKEHKKARHIPYAYIFKNTAKKTDDKEPLGTAGIQIYNTLERENLNSHLIAVVRYFGGTKLGAGNLLRAYRDSAKEVIKKES